MLTLITIRKYIKIDTCIYHIIVFFNSTKHIQHLLDSPNEELKEKPQNKRNHR